MALMALSLLSLTYVSGISGALAPNGFGREIEHSDTNSKKQQH